MSLQEPPAYVDMLAHRVIGAAIEVHRVLGPGFREHTYQEALEIELGLRGIPFASQVSIPIRYKDQNLATEFRLDLVVADALLVELKAVERLLPIHLAQTLGYLGASKHALGLVLNFQSAVLKDGIRRVLPWRPTSDTRTPGPG